MEDIEFIIYDEIRRIFARRQFKLVDKWVDLQLMNVIKEMHEIDTMFRIMRGLKYQRLALEENKNEMIENLRAITK